MPYVSGLSPVGCGRLLLPPLPRGASNSTGDLLFRLEEAGSRLEACAGDEIHVKLDDCGADGRPGCRVCLDGVGPVQHGKVAFVLEQASCDSRKSTPFPRPSLGGHHDGSDTKSGVPQASKTEVYCIDNYLPCRDSDRRVAL